MKTRTRTLFTIERKPRRRKMIEAQCPRCRCWRSASRCCACGVKHG